MILFAIEEAVIRKCLRDWKLENESPGPGPGDDDVGLAAAGYNNDAPGGRRRGPRPERDDYEGMMLTTFFDFPYFLKFTTPSVSAKSVSSLPIPTPTPGEKAVPRWRTMMLPAVTVSPPNRFTPRRCELLSRPFLELPPPFL
jgi:hypothetical protein